jgi:hypothetical protein
MLLLLPFTNAPWRCPNLLGLRLDSLDVLLLSTFKIVTNNRLRSTRVRHLARLKFIEGLSAHRSVGRHANLVPRLGEELLDRLETSAGRLGDEEPDEEEAAEGLGAPEEEGAVGAQCGDHWRHASAAAVCRDDIICGSSAIERKIQMKKSTHTGRGSARSC